MITVFLFQSSALAAGANTALISAMPNTVVAALNSFISSFPLSGFVVCAPLVPDGADLGGYFPRFSIKAIRQPFRPDRSPVYTGEHFWATGSWRPGERLTVQGHVTECGQGRLPLKQAIHLG